VETSEEAIKEVKLLIEKVPKIEKNLEESLEKLRIAMDDVQSVLQNLKT
jgi:prefoldin subunit 5